VTTTEILLQKYEEVPAGFSEEDLQTLTSLLLRLNDNVQRSGFE
jgi:hypothetical protein